MISVVNPSDNPVTLRVGLPIAAVSPLQFPDPTVQINFFAITHLPRDEKLKKILADLQFNVITLDSDVKSKLRTLIEEQLDFFAECDSDIGTTNFVFHEIDTGNSCPLRLPASRVPYGDQRVAIESEIENPSKLTSRALQLRRGLHPS